MIKANNRSWNSFFHTKIINTARPRITSNAFPIPFDFEADDDEWWTVSEGVVVEVLLGAVVGCLVVVVGDAVVCFGVVLVLVGCDGVWVTVVAEGVVEEAGAAVAVVAEGAVVPCEEEEEVGAMLVVADEWVEVEGEEAVGVAVAIWEEEEEEKLELRFSLFLSLSLSTSAMFLLLPCSHRAHSSSFHLSFC